MKVTVHTGYAARSQFIPFHLRDERFAALVCHRRAGKTVAAVMDAFDTTMRCKRPAARGAYIAPQYRQAKEVAWDYLKQYTRGIPGVVPNETELRIDLPGDKRFRLYGADNPDSLRGIYLDAVVLDEPAQMKPEAWIEVIRPALADRQGRATFIGTPKGRNWFYELFRNAERDPEWFTMILRASESGLLLPEELAAAKRDMPDAEYEQEFECSFEAPASQQFIPNAVVDAARARRFEAGAYYHAPRVIGVDVARHGNDSSTIVKRQGVMLWKPQRYRYPDLMQIAAEVAREIEEWKPDAVFIDATGMGWGVVDRLRQLKYKHIYAVQTGEAASDPNRWFNLRVELWDRGRDWLKEAAFVPDDPLLISDLLTPESWYDTRHRLCLETKEKIKARGMPSPDSGDGLMLTFAHSVGPRTTEDEPEWVKKLKLTRRSKRHKKAMAA